MTRDVAKAMRSKGSQQRAHQIEPAGLGVLAGARRGFELVSIDGELAMVLRLGRPASDPVPELAAAPRRYTIRAGAVEPETITEFLGMMTRRASGARTRAGVLQSRYRDWCYGKGVSPASRNALRRAIEARGFRDRHTNGTYWFDLALLDAPDVGALL